MLGLDKRRLKPLTVGQLIIQNSVANEIVRRLNVLLNIQVRRGGADRVDYGEDGVIITVREDGPQSQT